MQGINSINLDVNTARYPAKQNRLKIPTVSHRESKQGSDNKSRFVMKENISFNPDNLFEANNSYRTNLLTAFYMKMSGNEPRFKPGSFIEYFA